MLEALKSFDVMLILILQLEEDVGISPDEFAVTVQQMLRHIHLQQLRRICGFHHSPLVDKNKEKQLIKRLCHLYIKGNELCPKDERLPTDFCPADAYILLATHFLHQLWVDTNDASLLYE